MVTSTAPRSPPSRKWPRRASTASWTWVGTPSNGYNLLDSTPSPSSSSRRLRPSSWQSTIECPRSKRRRVTTGPQGNKGCETFFESLITFPSFFFNLKISKRLRDIKEFGILPTCWIRSLNLNFSKLDCPIRPKGWIWIDHGRFDSSNWTANLHQFLHQLI